MHRNLGYRRERKLQIDISGNNMYAVYPDHWKQQLCKVKGE